MNILRRIGRVTMVCLWSFILLFSFICPEAKCNFVTNVENLLKFFLMFYINYLT